MAKKRSEKDEDKPLGQFATILVDKLEAQQMSVMKLAEDLGRTYEHTRKLVRGLAFPSRYLLKDISKLLKLDDEEMWKLVVSDKIQTKYGGIPEELSGKTPRFTQVERLLPKITEDQFQSLMGMLEGWAKRNKN